MNPPEECADEYEVERILNKAKVGPQVYYLVKWKGYEERESSWEPVSHMLRSCEMVTEYELDTAQEYRLVRGEHYWPPLKLKNLQDAETVERIGPEHWRCLPAQRSLAQEPLSILSHYWTSPHLNQIRTIRFIVENSPDSYGAPRQSSVSLHELEQRVPKLLVEYLANHPLSSNYG